MTHSELFKLSALQGQLEGRQICLESNINATGSLIAKLSTALYQVEFVGQLKILKQWREDNARVLGDVRRIVKEAENAEQETNVPF